jgi:lipopolysaccharide transport system permease protein
MMGRVNNTTRGAGRWWVRALWPLVLADLRHRYGGSPWAAFWTLLAPMVEVAAYVLLFGFLLAGRIPQTGLAFALFLAAGILPWASLREGLEGAATVLHENRWVRRSTVPFELLVARQVVSALPRSAFGLSLVYLVAWGVGTKPGAAWFWPVVALPLQTAAAYGIGLALAPLAILYSGFRPLLVSALTLLTFASPILYPEALVGERARIFLSFNPFTHLLRFYRSPLDLEVAVSATDVAVSLVAPVACLALGSLLKARLWWPARDRL